jgi:hypothetical protein
MTRSTEMNLMQEQLSRARQDDLMRQAQAYREAQRVLVLRKLQAKARKAERVALRARLALASL